MFRAVPVRAKYRTAQTCKPLSTQKRQVAAGKPARRSDASSFFSELSKFKTVGRCPTAFKADVLLVLQQRQQQGILFPRTPSNQHALPWETTARRGVTSHLALDLMAKAVKATKKWWFALMENCLFRTGVRKQTDSLQATQSYKIETALG